MEKTQKLQEKLLKEMEGIDDCCRPLLEMAIELADIQAQEMDRFWKAVGLHDKDISIDDAIEIVSDWKKKATALRRAKGD